MPHAPMARLPDPAAWSESSELTISTIHSPSSANSANSPLRKPPRRPVSLDSHDDNKSNANNPATISLNLSATSDLAHAPVISTPSPMNPVEQHQRALLGALADMHVHPPASAALPPHPASAVPEPTRSVQTSTPPSEHQPLPPLQPPKIHRPPRPPMRHTDSAPNPRHVRLSLSAASDGLHGVTEGGPVSAPIMPATRYSDAAAVAAAEAAGLKSPVQAALPKETLEIELRFSCAGLPSAEMLSNPDAFLVVFQSHFGVGVQELLRTETVPNDISPEWVANLVIPPRARPVLVLDVYNRSGTSKELDAHAFLGRMQFAVEDLLLAKNCAIALPLEDAEDAPSARVGVVPRRVRARGALRVMAERIPPRPPGPAERILEMRVCATAIRERGVAAATRGTIPQFYEVLRQRPKTNSTPSSSAVAAIHDHDDDDWVVVHRSPDLRTPAHAKDVYLHWQPARMTQRLVCCMEPQRKIRIAFWGRRARRAAQVVAVADLDWDTLVTQDALVRMHGGRKDGMRGEFSVEGVNYTYGSNTTAVEIVVDHFITPHFKPIQESVKGRRRAMLKKPVIVAMNSARGA